MKILIIILRPNNTFMMKRNLRRKMQFQYFYLTDRKKGENCISTAFQSTKMKLYVKCESDGKSH